MKQDNSSTYGMLYILSFFLAHFFLLFIVFHVSRFPCEKLISLHLAEANHVSLFVFFILCFGVLKFMDTLV